MADRDRRNDDRGRDWSADRETAWHGEDRYPPNNPEIESRRRHRGDDDYRRYGAGDYEQANNRDNDYGRYASERDDRYGERRPWQAYDPGRDSPEYRDRSGYGWRNDPIGMNRTNEWRGEAGPSARPDDWHGGYERGYGEDRSFWDRTKDELASWFGDRSAEQRRIADGEHRGRGPKSYRRSDDRIHDDVNDRLTDDSWLDASDIEVRVDRSEVILDGRVRTRDDKRRAEAIAEQVSGVSHVQNNLRVDDFRAASSYSPVPPSYPF